MITKFDTGIVMLCDCFYINERDLPIKFSPKCILANSADSAGFSVPCNVHVCPYLGENKKKWTKLFHKLKQDIFFIKVPVRRYIKAPLR